MESRDGGRTGEKEVTKEGLRSSKAMGGGGPEKTNWNKQPRKSWLKRQGDRNPYPKKRGNRKPLGGREGTKTGKGKDEKKKWAERKNQRTPRMWGYLGEVKRRSRRTVAFA